MTSTLSDLSQATVSPEETSAPSVIKTHCLAVLSAQRALAKAVGALGDAWAAEEATRNRPGRQKLTTDLVMTLPKPMDVGDAVYAIAEECNVQL